MRNLLLMNRMLDRDTGIVLPDGRVYKPIYNYGFSRESMKGVFEVCHQVSSQMWGYFGYSGLISPWQDDPDPRAQFNFQQKTILSLMKFLEDEDIDLWSYCVLVCAVSDYTRYERPALLFGQRTHRSWMKKLRKHAGSRQRVKDVATFMLRFIELQVEHRGVAQVRIKNILGTEVGGRKKAFITYHRIADRIKQMVELELDWLDWLALKVRNFLDFRPKEMPLIKMIVNFNNLDPDMNALRRKMDDRWREIREFLNLSDSCEFPDGYIPKGWVPSNDDFKDSKNIARIRGDGFYFYPNGEQRRGKRHYASNTYFGIRCDPTNFHMFRKDWHKTSLLTSRPKWEEYRDYAISPGRWDEKGEPDKPWGRKVKWRTR